MSISIQTNVTSLVAQENLRVTDEFAARTIQRLTSGYRINASGDDAAGLAVANGFRSDVVELVQGVRNANDAVSMLQLIDGGLSNVTRILERLKTLATESATDTFTGDRTVLNAEYGDLLTEITRQATNVNLNTGGSWAADLNVYIGGGSSATVTISLAGTDVSATGLALAAGVDTAANAATAITEIETALSTLGTVQGTVGTGQNKLYYAIQLAQSQIASFSAAESRIRDADVAAEAANLTKAQVLQQASLAAMAQANAAPQAVLALLRS